MPGSCKCGKLAQPDGRAAYTVHLLWLSIGQGISLIRVMPLLPELCKKINPKCCAFLGCCFKMDTCPQDTIHNDKSFK